jgi:F-type H+-transporting ATPase subunit delta
MRDESIARNYAETLLALAKKAEDIDGWGKTLQGVADAVNQDATLRHFLESPRVSAPQKNAVLGKAFADRMPRLFLRFLQTLVNKRRQNLIPEIAIEYQNLLDREHGRVHANVTVARAADDAERKVIAEQLSRAFGREVVPHVSVDPRILGGVVVKVGDTVMDGSVRRRLGALRARMQRTV